MTFLTSPCLSFRHGVLFRSWASSRIAYIPSRASSLSAIHRGLHNSEKAKRQNVGGKYASSKSSKESRPAKASFAIRKGKKDISDKPPGPPTRAQRFRDPDHSFGKKSLVYQIKSGQFGDMLGSSNDKKSARTKPAGDKREYSKGGTAFSAKRGTGTGGGLSQAQFMEHFESSPGHSSRSGSRARDQRKPGSRSSKFQREATSFNSSRGNAARGDDPKSYRSRSTDRDFLKGEQDFQLTRDRDFQLKRERDFQPTRERDFQPTRERDSRPTRERDFQPTRDRDFQPTRERDSRPTRDRDFQPTREQDSQPWFERDSRPTRERDFQPTREPQKYERREQSDSRPNVARESQKDESTERDYSRQNIVRETEPDERHKGFFRTDSFQPRDEGAIRIHHTTAASQFLYGRSVVEAALRTARRRLYRLYINKGEDRLQRDPVQDRVLETLARDRNVRVVNVRNDGLPMLNKMSGGRPHNGFILEASPLPQMPIKNLGALSEDPDQPGFSLGLTRQSIEEAQVNGTSDFVSCHLPPGRKPFVLLLEGILDPGNLGGILRTATFLGVNAVAIGAHNRAPLSAIALKASSGASEVITLFSLSTSTIDFLERSKEEGWMVYSAVPESRSRTSSHISVDRVESYDPLSTAPTILVVGSEGEGLTKQIRRASDYEVSIPSSPGLSSIVDSLNVSVATGILCAAFVKKQNFKIGVEESKEPTDESPEDQLW
ncbi:hypothetical protein F5B20DRAFT_521541 [Whalleya microplaca]|nr:hypothetical protein F5B20DRAFT_521541 [Whalleya microplaca]